MDRDEVRSGSAGHEAVRTIVTAVERASELSQRMPAFSGRTALRLRCVDLNEVVEEALGLVEHDVARHVSVCFDAGRGECAVPTDRTQLAQVLSNLRENCRVATPVRTRTQRPAVGRVGARARELEHARYRSPETRPIGTLVSVAVPISLEPAERLRLGRRVHTRYAVDAQGVWSAGGHEIRSAVGTMSWGGASLIGCPSPLPKGTRLIVRFTQSQHELGTAEMEVVYVAGAQMGLRFLVVSPLLEHSLEGIFADLTPL